MKLQRRVLVTIGLGLPENKYYCCVFDVLIAIQFGNIFMLIFGFHIKLNFNCICSQLNNVTEYEL